MKRLPQLAAVALVAALVVAVVLAGPGLLGRPPANEGSAPTTAIAHELEPVGYVVARGGVVQEVSDPSIPLAAGEAAPESLFAPHPASGDYVVETWSGHCAGTGRLYRCEGGVLVVDTSAPDRPIAARYDTPQIPTDVLIADDLMFVSWRGADTLASGGLVVLDISDVPDLLEVARYETGAMRWATGVDVYDRYVYLVTLGGLEILAITQKADGRLTLTHAGRFQTEGTPLRALAVEQNLVFLIWGTPCAVPSYPLRCDHVLRVLDVSDPTAPKEAAIRDLPDSGEAYVWPDPGHALAIIGAHLYVPLDGDRWQVFRVH